MQQPFTIIIVGGGTAGWMTAAAISSCYKDRSRFQIMLIESEDIGSIGVGEATLPSIKSFNDQLGISEPEMMRRTQATFKLGIKFLDWGRTGNRYIHPFGLYGSPNNTSEFYQCWAQTSARRSIPELARYSFAVQLCESNGFKFPSKNTKDIESTFSYAYHFDATLYARLLREISENAGVRRINGIVDAVMNNPDTGDITAVVLKDGQELRSDFFIDCSGFRSLLLQKNLGAEFEDWSHWLLCDRAIAVQSGQQQDIPPYTTSTAKEGGWQWRIPLQHRAGNGYVYCSNAISDDEAYDSLLKNIHGDVLTEPRFITFKTGRYKKSWSKNCVAIGLSSGFLEPLESTSIYLIHIAIVCLLRLFPAHANKRYAALSDEYNRLIDNEYERIRDFLILHYHLNERTDAEFWRHCRTMQVPESLSQKIDLFKRRGYSESFKYGLFSTPSWLAVLHGQGLQQAGIDPFISSIPAEQLDSLLEEVSNMIDQGLVDLSNHEQFVKAYCASKE
jgi:tryptophan 7-halogenase